MGIIPGEVPRAGRQRDDPGYSEQRAPGLRVEVDERWHKGPTRAGSDTG